MPDLTELRARLTRLLAERPRVLVGIAGPPGAGKSTLAQALAEEFDDAVAVPMDGFHLSHVELVRLGLANRKGAPETFDPDGYAHLLRRIRDREELVYAPAYSRIVHESIGGVIPVPAHIRLVVTEGNYLLVPQAPWGQLRELFDLTVYLDAPADERVAGLIRRQLSFGLSEPDALDWVYRSDEANARVVAATQHLADITVHRRGSQ